MKIDDFDKEIESVRQNCELLEFLYERSREKRRSVSSRFANA
jgi:hypothetical protein